PTSVAELCSAPGRVDEIGEQDRHKSALRAAGCGCTGEVLLDLIEQRIPVAVPPQVVLPAKLDVSSMRYVRGQVAAMLDGYEAVVRAMHDERRSRDRWQRGANVHPCGHLEPRNRR